MKFEYKVNLKPDTMWTVQHEIDLMAANNWRLVAADKHWLYFERRIQKPKDRVRNS